MSTAIAAIGVVVALLKHQSIGDKQYYPYRLSDQFSSNAELSFFFTGFGCAML